MKTTGRGSAGRRSSVDVRREILAAAAAELAEVGADRASLRSISRRVGITHQALTYYFTDRKALLTAVAVDGFEKLFDVTAEAVAQVPAQAPLGDRVIAVGITYVHFAREYPELFTVMLRSAQIDTANDDLVAARHRMWQLLLDTVTNESNNGWGAEIEPQPLAIMSWTIVHGLATLGGQVPGPVNVGELLHTLNRAFAKRERADN